MKKLSGKPVGKTERRILKNLTKLYDNKTLLVSEV